MYSCSFIQLQKQKAQLQREMDNKIQETKSNVCGIDVCNCNDFSLHGRRPKGWERGWNEVAQKRNERTKRARGGEIYSWSSFFIITYSLSQWNYFRFLPFSASLHGVLSVNQVRFRSLLHDLPWVSHRLRNFSRHFPPVALIFPRFLPVNLFFFRVCNQLQEYNVFTAEVS